MHLNSHMLIFSIVCLFAMFGSPLIFSMMVLEQQTRLFTPAAWAPADTATTVAASLLGSQQRFQIPRSNPIEAIYLILDLKTDTTSLGPVPRTGSTGNVGRDNILGVIRKVVLEGVSPDWGAYKIVDFSGIGLTEYNLNAGLNLDTATLDYISKWQVGANPVIAVDTEARYIVKIPIVYPMVGEPLLTRCLLPCHTWDQDPVLTVDFESATNMYSAGNYIRAKCSIFVVYRECSEDQTNLIKSKGGFIRGDLVENSFSPGVGVSGEQRFTINSPGSYMALNFRHYLGGNAVTTRDEVSETTTSGSESLWRLETNGNVKRQFRWKHVNAMNQYSRPLNALTQASSPSVNAAIAGGTLFAPAASCMLDFFSDGIEVSNELGSILDCNTPAKSGLKMEIVGPWKAPGSATLPSTIFYGGHRLWGDLTPFKSRLANS